MPELVLPLPKGVYLSKDGLYSLPLEARWNGYHKNKVDAKTVKIVREWSRARIRKTKTYPKRGLVTSYGLKHLAQKELGVYVSNGDLIAALILEGFEYTRFSLNARFKHGVVK